MPFELLETHTKANMPPTAKMSYLRSVRKGKELDRGKVKPKLIVTLPTTVCVSQCEKFMIQIGTGTDTGKVRICGLKKGAPGGIKGADFKNHLMLRFGYVPRLGDEIFDSVECPITKIDADTYELSVPPSLFAPAGKKAA